MLIRLSPQHHQVVPAHCRKDQRYPWRMDDLCWHHVCHFFSSSGWTRSHLPAVRSHLRTLDRVRSHLFRHNARRMGQFYSLQVGMYSSVKEVGGEGRHLCLYLQSHSRRRVQDSLYGSIVRHSGTSHDPCFRSVRNESMGLHHHSHRDVAKAIDGCVSGNRFRKGGRRENYDIKDRRMDHFGSFLPHHNMGRLVHLQEDG